MSSLCVAMPRLRIHLVAYLLTPLQPFALLKGGAIVADQVLVYLGWLAFPVIERQDASLELRPLVRTLCPNAA